MPGASIWTAALAMATAAWGVVYVTALPSFPVPAGSVPGLLSAVPFLVGFALGRRAAPGGRPVRDGVLAGALAAGLEVAVVIALGAPAAPAHLLALTLAAVVLAALGALAGGFWRSGRPRSAAAEREIAWLAAALTALFLAALALPWSATPPPALAHARGLLAFEAPVPVFRPLALLLQLTLASLLLIDARARRPGAPRVLLAVTLLVAAGLASWSLLRVGRPGLVVAREQAGTSALQAFGEGVAQHLLLVLLAAYAVWPGKVARPSPSPRSTTGAESTRTVQWLAVVVGVLLLVQLGLASAQRVDRGLVLFHMLTGAALVLPLVVRLAIGAWLGPGADSESRRLAYLLLAAIALQVLLGMLAYARGSLLAGLLPTLHLWLGLGLLVLVAKMWARESVLSAGRQS